jgi:glycosyltransferase involved in cell wall biosynthesis
VPIYFAIKGTNGKIRLLILHIVATYALTGLTDGSLLRATSLTFYIFSLSTIIALSLHSNRRWKTSSNTLIPLEDREPIIVIMATYNRHERLHRAIESVLNQTSDNWRLIVIDDGSDDGTADYINNINDPRVHPFSLEKNSGVNKARNKALDIIQDKGLDGFITLLDDDDIFTPTCLADMSDHIYSKSLPKFDWYTADCVTLTGKKISIVKKYGRSSYIYDYMYGKNIRGDLTHFIHTGIIEDSRFSSHFKNSEEWYFFAQLSTKHDLFSISYPAKIVYFSPDGLLAGGSNRDKKIDVLSYKISVLKDMVPKKYSSIQSISLANQLAKIGKNSEAEALLKDVSPLNRIRYKYILAYVRIYFK